MALVSAASAGMTRAQSSVQEGGKADDEVDCLVLKYVRWGHFPLHKK